MGLKRVDFGNDVETAARVKALKTSPGTGWLAELLEAKYTTSKSSDNVGIELVFKVTDEDATDIDGTPFTGKKQWDRIWFSEKSLKMTKIKLAGLGIDVDTLIIEDEADVQDLAADLRENAGLEVSLVVEAKEDNYGTGEYWDGTQKYKTDVKFINAIS